MSELIRKQVRTWCVDRAVGFLSDQEFVARVDRAILETPDPPWELLELSMRADIAWSGPLDIVLHPIRDADAAELAARILQAIDASTIGLADLESIASSAARLIPDCEESAAQLVVIADDCHMACQVAEELGQEPHCESTMAEVKARLRRVRRLAGRRS